jgi:hypothetical protein
MKKVIGVNGLKDIVTSLHGVPCEASSQVYCEALDELQERLSQSKYNEFISSL